MLDARIDPPALAVVLAACRVAHAAAPLPPDAASRLAELHSWRDLPGLVAALRGNVLEVASDHA